MKFRQAAISSDITGQNFKKIRPGRMNSLSVNFARNLVIVPPTSRFQAPDMLMPIVDLTTTIELMRDGFHDYEWRELHQKNC